MPRKLKAKEVKLYKHPSGVKIGINLDRETMTFQADVAEGASFESKTAEELIDQIKQYLDSATKLDWRPVIEIECRDLSTFKFTRYYTAVTADNTWRKLNFESWQKAETDAEERLRCYGTNVEMERLRISHHDYHDKDFSFDALPYFKESHWSRDGSPDSAIIVYTPENWAALEAIQNALDLLKTKLRDVITSKKGLEALQSAGAKAVQLLLK